MCEQQGAYNGVAHKAAGLSASAAMPLQFIWVYISINIKYIYAYMKAIHIVRYFDILYCIMLYYLLEIDEQQLRE